MLRPPYTCYDRLVVYHLDRGTALSVDDEALIGVWQEDGTTVLFFHQERDRLVQDVCARFGLTVSYRAELDYRDWEAGVEIVPFRTRELAVRPVWREEDATGERGSRRSIVLDPGVVFGSGFHATTRLCLETLEEYVAGPRGQAASVLDLGTGTGLLAIAAATLGAERVTGVDYNPLACAVARANCRRNPAAAGVRIVQVDLARELPDTACDLILVNLYKGLLETLFAEPRFWLGRRYIVSGFLPSMEADLLAALPPGRLRVLERRSRENWRLWVLENTALAGEVAGC
ncbi:MAG: hypothetical protein BWK76_02425 [Desulfobulbaceae bacterium A2]|nr:MAG: hypothetical protein BWK76_02425 [Desulfobulbaceae bacterium A2]